MRLHPLPLAIAVAAAPAFAADSNQAVTSGSAFNPAISLVLSGSFYQDSANGVLPAPAGLDKLPAAVPDQGFTLGESELVLTASVDPDFDAATNIVLDGQGKAAIEEAWFETRQLPAGLTVRVGKMKSNIGYLNSQHPHTWDFADQNLAYDALLGGEGISDAGVRVEWLPDLPLYTLLGTEALQGKQDVVGAEVTLDPAATTLTPPVQKRGPRLFTAYAKVAPDLGFNNALELGAWGLRAQQQQELYGTPGTDAYLLDGSETLYGLEAVYKYDGGGENGDGSVKVQGEFLHGQKDLAVATLDSGATFVNSGAAVSSGDKVNGVESAWYLQAVYGIAPRWQAGMRIDQSGIGSRIREAGVQKSFDSSHRASAVLTWNPTEFSRLRLQYARADITDATGTSKQYDQYFLTYSMALGTHGAHKF